MILVIIIAVVVVFNHAFHLSYLYTSFYTSTTNQRMALPRLICAEMEKQRNSKVR